ncbi:tRNA(Ile)-lysidine synthase [Filimonas lacunae]|uniref:tRNA(Ile)-lysidine synthase n=1 Tax=Filimonas lacunae TaxID=477680 RepID=A0A173MAW7_9BACT|nr:tRNA lysidine(34) synthetase TilS [Filimonas lacunae]BAV04649.1 tRNA(Ile)-lysidine synthetase [Filimonas lacunae]SIT32503.1 tRNA(Ile)-lysidine synthase [Filimonas lacunae]
MNVPERFMQSWKQRFPHLPSGQCHVLLAVSGGIDSVVLAHLLHIASINFTILHCNFGLRGQESIRDEEFVRSLGQQFQVPVWVQPFNTVQWAQQHKMAIQEAARVLRYNWFAQMAREKEAAGPVAIATAHHANDNIETLLMNFFRGTGIQGLHGIQPMQGNLIRPLLFATREEIVQYAAQHGLQWVEDSSNASEKYTRNYFRLQLIPALKNIFPAVEDNLLHNIERFNEVEMLYTQAVTQQLAKLVEHKGNEIHIPIFKLLKTEPMHTLLWEIIRPCQFTAAQVEEVKKLMYTGHNGSYIASPTHRIIKNRNWLIIAPAVTETAKHVVVEQQGSVVVFKEGTLLTALQVAQPAEAETQNSPLVAMLDAKDIEFPLLLRPWKQGDYFYPLGMQKKKKINRFLIDQKLSATDKEKVWVLEMNQKIIWIVGRRIDNRFKVKPATQNVLICTYQPIG